MYLPNNLEQRIADRDKFPNAVHKKDATANHIEKQVNITVMNMIIEIKKFRRESRKIDPKKNDVFQNDANVNYLLEQLCIIGEFNFSSKPQMRAEVESFKSSIAHLGVIEGSIARLNLAFIYVVGKVLRDITVEHRA